MEAGVVLRALAHSVAGASLLHVHTEILGPDGKPVTEQSLESHTDFYGGNGDATARQYKGKALILRRRRAGCSRSCGE